MKNQDTKLKIKSLTESKHILEDMIDRNDNWETRKKLETSLYNVLRQLEKLNQEVE